MGHVALSAGYYLMAKLGMHHLAEFPSSGLFDVDFAMVKAGVVQKTERPRSRLFVWKAPEGKRDVIVFIGEAQPPLGKYAFCEKLIDFARDQGVERLFTFAAMATEMHPEHESRVFAAATDTDALQELDRPEVRMLEEGHIGGLNGVLLAAAADKGMQGVCLLGEMPHIFAQIPFPKASMAVLKIFTEMAEVELDFAELAQQSEAIEQRLGELLAEVEGTLEAKEPQESEEDFSVPEEEKLSEEDEQRINSGRSSKASSRSCSCVRRHKCPIRMYLFGVRWRARTSFGSCIEIRSRYHPLLPSKRLWRTTSIR
jgi:proteasome assembly chaperone (PAC2) family protein